MLFVSVGRRSLSVQLVVSSQSTRKGLRAQSIAKREDIHYDLRQHTDRGHNPRLLFTCRLHELKCKLKSILKISPVFIDSVSARTLSCKNEMET